MFEVFAIDEALRHEDPGSPVPALYATLGKSRLALIFTPFATVLWRGPLLMARIMNWSSSEMLLMTHPRNVVMIGPSDKMLS